MFASNPGDQPKGQKVRGGDTSGEEKMSGCLCLPCCYKKSPPGNGESPAAIDSSSSSLLQKPTYPPPPPPPSSSKVRLRPSPVHIPVPSTNCYIHLFFFPSLLPPLFGFDSVRSCLPTFFFDVKRIILSNLLLIAFCACSSLAEFSLLEIHSRLAY